MVSLDDVGMACAAKFHAGLGFALYGPHRCQPTSIIASPQMSWSCHQPQRPGESIDITLLR